MNESGASGGGESKTQDAVDISVRTYPVNEPRNNLLAYASVTLGGCFAVNDIRVMNSSKGPFVAMPSKKGGDGQFHDTSFPTTAQMRETLNAAVMNSFQSGQQADAPVKSDAALDVSVKIYPMPQGEGAKNNLLAYANVTVGGCFAVTDVRVLNGKNGPFVAMPSRKGKDQQYHDTCFPTTAAMREKLNAAVMGEFQRATQKESVRSAIHNSQTKAAAPATHTPARTRKTGAR